MIAHIDDHEQQAQSRLLSQFVTKPRILALVGALASRTQALEDAIQKVSTERFLSASSGAQLDSIGDLVGITRNGQSDDVYRILLIGQIAKNNSRGTLADVLTVTKTLYGAKAVFSRNPQSFGYAQASSMAELSVSVGSPTTDASLTPLIARIINQCMPEGTRLVSISSFDADGAMATNGPQSWCRGFGAPLAKLLYIAA